MARLRTDWILFLTILAMTGFGIVMVYSASSAAAKPLLQPSSLTISWLHQIGFAVVSFIVLMYFKRLDYRAMNTSAWAFSGLGIVLRLLIVVYFADPKAHRWFRDSRRGDHAAVRVRQARADSVSGVLHFAPRRSPSITARRCSKRSSPWPCWRCWWWLRIWARPWSP